MATKQVFFGFKTLLFKNNSLLLGQYNTCIKPANAAILKNLVRPFSISTHRNSASSYQDENGNVQVYFGILTPQIKAVKLFSLCTSVGGLIAQPILLQHGSTSMPLLVAACTIVGFFTFVTPFLLHIITKKYVTEIQYNPNSKRYTAIIYNFFLRKKKIIFQPEDVLVPEIPGMFTSFVAKGVPLFVEARLFEDPAHYAKIMGYDKPIDFKMDSFPKKL